MNAPNNQEGTTVAGRVAPEHQRTTHKPSGLPSWPMLLLAGAEKSGKSYEVAKFSGSDLIGRTLWIEVGEGEGHHYGAVPGARYELVPHDGSFRDILDAVRWAVWQPRGEDGKPNAIALDSASILWELVGDEQATIARRRAAQRAARAKQPAPPDPADYTITTDQWNVAKRRWAMVIDALRHHDGPVILCARMDEVTLFDAAGQPTKDRVWKVQAEKKLGFEVTGTVQLRGYKRAFLTGMRSLRLNIPPDQTVPYPGFSLDKLMRDLGLHELDTAPRTYVAPRPEAYVDEHDAEVARQAHRDTQTRDARQRASQGELPDSDEVAEAIRAAFDGGRVPLLEVRTHYGASTLQKIVIKTPWGSMDANSAIDSALLNLPPAPSPTPPGSQASRPAQESGPPPAHAHLNAAEIETFINEALAHPNQGAQILTRLRGDCGEEPLQQTLVRTKWGTIDADSAITRALAQLAEPQQDYIPEQPPAPPAEPSAASSEPPPPQFGTPMPPPEAPTRGVRRSPSERARENLLAEVTFQARMLGQNTLDFVAALLPEGATSVEQVQGGSRLSDHIREHRPQVLAALVVQGMHKAAGEYAAFGDRVPANIGQFIKRTLHPVEP
ncbi:hypothetical protein [Streptomyces microflavus]|uniref:hypothetical protein n=1 Tax=Streptomyces microflavus TaxID=1919 RepID=UPI0036489CBE